MLKLARTGALTLLFALLFATGVAHAERERYARAASPEKLFVDVVLDLEHSIGRHNFAIVGHNEIGEAVRREGHPAFGDAAIVHFCNLEYARQVIEIEPSLMLYMPCRIAIFESGGRAHAASLLLPDDTAFERFNTLAAEINRKIRAIIDYAVSTNEPAGTGGGP